MKTIITRTLLITLSLFAQQIVKAQINAQLLGRYSIGTYNSNGGVAEISAYDPASKRMFVINGPDSSVKIVNIANPANPVLVTTISVKPYGIDVTSVACNKNGVFAIAVIDSNGKTNPSSIVFLDVNGNYINKVKAGPNADHIIFTSNGQKLIVANEGEPNVGYTIDPEGSISIIDLANGVANITQANVQTAGFSAFNAPAVIDPKIRIFGKIQTSGGAFLRNSTVAEDLEPEYIAISDDNATAWVTCQENNAIAVVNINNATVTSLLPLGYKNHRLVGNGLDPSDRDNGSNGALAKIDTFPVFGLYLPDGISHFKTGNQSYLVTANEGDARADWGTANNEENRVGDAAYVLDSTKFGGATGMAAIKANSYLGRLTVTNRYGDFNNDGKFDSIFAFGTRSFSIWNGTTGALVWDSKDEIEQKVKSMFPANFNTGHTTNALDDRSDNKGPEPESVTVGKIKDSTYAFIGLERIGGIMIYNITNPNAPYFVQYINTRNFSVTPNQTNLASVGDLGPEGIVFIPASESPNGVNMIMLSNEVSGTVALFNINTPETEGISKLQDYQNYTSAAIGTFQGINYKEAGFSSLFPISNTNGTEFWTCSDRGVNIDCANANTASCRPTYDKMYAFPTYSPKIHRIRIAGDSIQILQTITIKRPNGTGATGIINPTGLGSTATEIASTDTVLNCADFSLKTTPKDTFGIDPEGLVVDKLGNFWLCEEGGATIWKLNQNGVLLNRYTPYAHLAGKQAVDIQIDSVFKYRKNNRGFEGISIAPNGKIYAMIQSGIQYPTATIGDNTRIHRILEIDPATNNQRMLVYLNDGIIGTGSNQIRLRDWKIGDMAAVNDSTFLVLEAAARGTSDIKRLYQININQATAVHSGLYGSLTLEGLVDSTGLANNGIKPVTKTLVMDLLASGWPAALDKAEGLAIINDSTIAIGNDNDFGQTSPLANGIATATGNLSHLITYRMSGAKKLANYKIAAPTFTLQILHASDMESGIDAPIDAPNFAAVLDTLEGTYPNTVKLASGDCFIPSPFLSAGEDPSMQTPLRNTASSYYAGTTSGLRAAIGRTDVAMMNIMGFQGSAFGNHEFDLGTPEVNSIIGVDIRNNGADKRWIGAQFPYLSANLNFSNDINLSYLTTNQRLLVDSFKTSPNITANTQKKGIAPSAIIEMNGEKVGIVGATTQVLAAISSPGATTVLSGGADNMPALAAVLQPAIDSLRAMGINKIILMSHLQQLANEKALAPLLKGVDIIIAGGSHSLCADGNDRLRPGIPVSDKYPILTINKDNEPLAILNTTSEWKYVGRFVCDFDSSGVLLPNLLDSTINGAYAADTAMVTALYGSYAAGFNVGSKGANVRVLTTAIATVINNKDGNKFGKTSVFLEGRRNLVRTEETNFGNLSSDANLWYARQYDNQVKVSIKNGGGIRSAIGNVNAIGTTTLLEKTLANPSAGKLSGDISQLDIENSLRFNNGLVIATTNTAGLKRLLEHGISATKPGATPGQFPQVGGVAFSYDTTKVIGSKIQSMVIIDSIGNKIDTLVKNGLLVGDTSRTIKFVTLDFLYTGGDNYPFIANSTNRVNLDTAIKNTGIATFTLTGKEQDAFAEYMGANYNVNPFNGRDTTLKGDKRIQLLNARLEGIIIPNASTSSSQSPYLTPIANGVQFTSLLTAGDVINGYKMAGNPDGSGAYDNNDGTFTMLISHEFGSTVGAVHAHGAKGAFVSKWVINKNNLSVVSGADLIQRVNLYTPGVGYTLYNAADTGYKKAFNRFCSSDLPVVSAFYNATTGLGTQERIFMNGEESGAEGRAFGHIVTGPNAGTTYELPALGKFSWENSVANPATGNKTVVAGTDDATPGQVYIYIGNKTNSGTEMDKAGLTNGSLYGVAVNGLTAEVSASFPAANTNFTLVNLGNVKDSTGTSLNTRSNTLGITNFLRPEDAVWDPTNASDLYFVTTNGFGSPSRLWKLHFNNLNDLTLGGTVTALLDGTEGQQMLDNLTFDNFGHILLQEDVGNNVHNGKIWQYTLANDKLELLAQHDSTRFIAGAANYLTQDEESSGIIDVQNILGKGNFLLVDQAHYAVGGDQVEGGQILKMFNPTTANSKSIISIAEARALTTSNDTVRVRGVITRAWGRFIYIQDATGAIGVRQSSGAMVDSITNGNLKEGDSVEVFGAKGEFNNYAQLQLFSGAYSLNSKVIKLASNVQLPAPVLLTVKQLNQNGEQYESKLVRIVGLKTNATASTFAASTNNTVWDGSTTGDTTILRIIAAADTEIEDAPGLSIPKGIFTFEGILAQFCSSPTNGCALGYQLYGVRKKDIIPQLTPFNLITPITNTKIVTSAASSASVYFNWDKSLNATSHKWFITPVNGNFNNPWVNSIGNTDSSFTYSYSQFDTLAATKGIVKGDSILLKWTAYAYLGSDSMIAMQTNNIWVVREKPVTLLGVFNLLTPSNNARIEVEQNSNTPIEINWSKSANAMRYNWFATNPTGNFTTPLLNIPSNNAGVDTTLTLTSGSVDAILASLNVSKGDSAELKWTVYAYKLTSDSIKASQTFNLMIVRKNAVGLNEFDLNSFINVYPNPTDGNTTLSFTLQTADQLVMTITDIQGRLIGNPINVKGTSGINNLELATSEINAGAYFITLSSSTGKSDKTKLIIIK